MSVNRAGLLHFYKLRMRHSRFSLFKIFTWILMCALHLGALTLLSTSIPAMCVSFGVICVLLAADAVRGFVDDVGAPALSVARYSFDLLVAIAVAFAVLLVWPPHGTSSATGSSVADWGTDALEAIGEAFAIVFRYLRVIGLLSLVCFASAVRHFNRNREAKYLTIFSIPGLCLLVYCLFVMAIEFAGTAA